MACAANQKKQAETASPRDFSCNVSFWKGAQRELVGAWLSEILYCHKTIYFFVVIK